MEDPGLNWLVGRGLDGRLWGGGTGLKEDGGTAGVGCGMKELLGEKGRSFGTAGVGLPTKVLGLVKVFPFGLNSGTAGVGCGMNGLGLVNLSPGLAVPRNPPEFEKLFPGLAVPRKPPDG